MSHENQDDEVREKMPIKKSWNPPHIDGESFLNGYIHVLSTRIEEHGSFREDVVSKNTESEEDEEWQDVMGGIGVDDENYWVLESKDPIHPIELLGENLCIFNDLIARAKDNLAARDLLELQEVLYEILDIRGMLGSEPIWDNGVIENWASVLDDTKRAAKDQEESESIINKVKVVIHEMCVRFSELIAKNPAALQQIEWRQLENVIAATLERLGFEVELTPPSKDGGKDIIATCVLHGQKMTFYVEIKHWRSGKHVGSKEIFNFVEVNVADRTAGGLFISSSGFTQTAYSQLTEVTRQRIRLAKEEKIVSLCQHFVRKQKGIWQPVQSLPEVLFERTL